MSLISDSKPESYDNDLEDQLTSTPDQEEAGFDRRMPNWKWYLVCVGIYTAALLYGMST